jgi:hypothetical protein
MGIKARGLPWISSAVVFAPLFGVGTESTSMANSDHRGPRALGEILGELFAVRGYGRLRALSELEEAWNSAVGEPHCHQTRVGDVRRGVLNVTVAHPTLLEELDAFRKPALLQALRVSASGAIIRDIRFRVGPVEESEPSLAGFWAPPNSTSPPAQRSKARPGTVARRGKPRGRGNDHGRTRGED